jgi:3-phenylpropionate/trans-cinnamate dioxygenase ferredoxin reductase subunit
VPLQHVLGRELGVVYHELHASEGVDLVPGATIEAFEGNGRVERARLADGRTFDCDFVVVGVGIEPRVQLAEAAGLAVDDGVVTDELLRTDVEGIFAAGDVASAYHPFFERRLRIEHWSNARYQAPAAALNMLGRGKAYDRIPTFFSEQYGVSLDYVGFAQSWDQVVIRGDTSERELVAFYLVDGRVMAALAIDVPDQRDVLADLIRARSRLDRSRLADPDIPLSELVETPTRT